MISTEIRIDGKSSFNHFFHYFSSSFCSGLITKWQVSIGETNQHRLSSASIFHSLHNRHLYYYDKSVKLNVFGFLFYIIHIAFGSHFFFNLRSQRRDYENQFNGLFVFNEQNSLKLVCRFQKYHHNCKKISSCKT